MAEMSQSATGKRRGRGFGPSSIFSVYKHVARMPSHLAVRRAGSEFVRSGRTQADRDRLGAAGDPGLSSRSQTEDNRDDCGPNLDALHYNSGRRGRTWMAKIGWVDEREKIAAKLFGQKTQNTPRGESPPTLLNADAFADHDIGDFRWNSEHNRHLLTFTDDGLTAEWPSRQRGWERTLSRLGSRVHLPSVAQRQVSLGFPRQ